MGGRLLLCPEVAQPLAVDVLCLALAQSGGRLGERLPGAEESTHGCPRLAGSHAQVGMANPSADWGNSGHIKIQIAKKLANVWTICETFSAELIPHRYLMNTVE